MSKIENPILRGFNPDPAILRVDDDYYIVTSTFEWFPGYQIHHSKDLVNWRLLNRPLDRASQLDMRGVPDSCGVWAPCLSHHDGVFYLIYSNVRSFDGDWKDIPNYLVTATNINGPWSEPVYLNSSGFDASLFHDDDGKSYLVNMLMDHRKRRFFGGIVLQEYDRSAKKLVGPIHYIFEGTEHGRTEGPHLYKRNGYYYLLLAEGGTGYEHCITLARSKNLTGPYEVHPKNPVITSKYNPDAYLQKTGHGALVETQTGEHYLTFLTGRPLSKLGRCITGRESGIEKVEWRDDGWLYLAAGGREARRYVEAPALPAHSFEAESTRVDFSTPDLNKHWQALRIPITPDWANQTDKPGSLTLVGRDSLSSLFDQSLLGRRVQAHHTRAETCVAFSPDNFQQMAGLVCYYNTLHWHYLHISGDDFGSNTGRKFLTLLSTDKHDTREPVEPLEITGHEKIYLKADYKGAELQFYYALEPGQWIAFGPLLDGSILSDDYVEGTDRFHPCFTGAFYGLCCQDLSGQRKAAYFDYFDYQEPSPCAD